MTDDDKLLYEELGKAWMHYVQWRERIFAGYLTALAAVGYAFSKETSAPVRAAVFGFAILISCVFRLLDIRTAHYVNLCQRAGRGLAGEKGLYAAIDKDRLTEKDERWYWKILRRVPLFGFAINALVAGVIGPSLVGLVIQVLKWRSGSLSICWWWSVVAAACAILVLAIEERCTRKIWKDEKADYTPK